MENSFILPYSLAATQLIPVKQVKVNNPVITHTLRIQAQFRKPSISPQTPLLNNHFFTPSKLDLAFRAWHSNGIHRIQDLSIDGCFTSFKQLLEKFKLRSSDFFLLSQIRHYVQHNFQTFPSLPPLISLDELLAITLPHRRGISFIYNFISNKNLQPTATNIRAVWGDDLGFTFSEEEWNQIQKWKQKEVKVKFIIRGDKIHSRRRQERPFMDYFDRVSAVDWGEQQCHFHLCLVILYYIFAFCFLFFSERKYIIILCTMHAGYTYFGVYFPLVVVLLYAAKYESFFVRVLLSYRPCGCMGVGKAVR